MSDIFTPKDLFAKVPESDGEVFIQWKGTEVCMDLNCPCGRQSHLDAMFAYFVQCPKCDTIYQLGTQVRLFKVEGREPYIEPKVGA